MITSDLTQTSLYHPATLQNVQSTLTPMSSVTIFTSYLTNATDIFLLTWELSWHIHTPSLAKSVCGLQDLIRQTNILSACKSPMACLRVGRNWEIAAVIIFIAFFWVVTRCNLVHRYEYSASCLGMNFCFVPQPSRLQHHIITRLTLTLP
jgi:hypothetical protein